MFQSHATTHSPAKPSLPVQTAAEHAMTNLVRLACIALWASTASASAPHEKVAAVLPDTLDQWKKAHSAIVFRSIFHADSVGVLTSFIEYGKKSPEGKDKKNAKANLKTFAQSLRPADVAACTSEECTKWMVDTLPHLKAEAKEALNAAHWKIIIRLAIDNPSKYSKVIEGLLKEIVSPLATTIVRLLNFDHEFKLLPKIPKTLQLVFSIPEVCSELLPKTLAWIMTESAGSNLSAGCLVQANLERVELKDKRPLKVPAASLRLSNQTLSPTILKTLKKGAVSEVAGEIE